MIDIQASVRLDNHLGETFAAKFVQQQGLKNIPKPVGLALRPMP